jgi:hypothetical protein
MADPDRIAETYLQLHRQHRSTWAFEIAETYLQLHRQHRSTWAFEIVLRPWVERW